VSRKKIFGEKVGVSVTVFALPADISEEALIQKVSEIAQDVRFSSMIVQLPLPQHIDREKILNLIPAQKDVDVLSRDAYARFERGVFPILPPLAAVVKEIFDREHVSLTNKKVVVMGQGRLVGHPVTTWLRLQRRDPAVVTAETKDISSITKSADIIITGLGDPHFITPDMVKDGVALIDGGTSESEGKIVGDIDPRCEEKASVFTPVPGGVGPLTVAMLFKNVVMLGERASG
jgi:methylenetetrahydrofolate dehydrogenase (NADP+)/methenyltetrahydrofolate cyclohydrolase